jgi:hypothetical protein
MSLKQNPQTQSYEITIGDKTVNYPFQILFERIQLLSTELGEEERLEGIKMGSFKAYYLYRYFLQRVMEKYKEDGLQSQVYLVPELIGYEGKEVNVKYFDGTEETFFVGKNGEALPYYIKLETKDSLYGDPIQKHIEYVFEIC